MDAFEAWLNIMFRNGREGDRFAQLCFAACFVAYNFSAVFILYYGLQLGAAVGQLSAQWCLEHPEAPRDAVLVYLWVHFLLVVVETLETAGRQFYHRLKWRGRCGCDRCVRGTWWA